MIVRVSSRHDARPTHHCTKFGPGSVDFRYAAITIVREGSLISNCIAYSLSTIAISLRWCVYTLGQHTRPTWICSKF